ncbi:MAG TPA: hypothetical protein VFL15_00610 [Gammaproteobacteria bacterium]|nr:hypothetical protein [Gammaproteobacteria bacterium]
MNIPADNVARARLWVALGNQPGVAAWFSVWTLSRNTPHRNAAERNPAKPAVDGCTPRAKTSPA